MNNEMKRIMEALMLIYGRDLQAVTITVLRKDGDTTVRYLTHTLPQVETKKGTPAQTNATIGWPTPSARPSVQEGVHDEEIPHSPAVL